MKVEKVERDWGGAKNDGEGRERASSHFSLQNEMVVEEGGIPEGSLDRQRGGGRNEDTRTALPNE